MTSQSPSLNRDNLSSEKNRRYLDLVATHAINAVVITNVRGEIEWVNDVFEQLSGYQQSEIVGKKPGDFLQGADTDPDTVREIQQALNNSQAVEVEILNYSSAQKAYWIQLSIKPVFNSEGDLVNFIGTQTNITQRKRQEYCLSASEARYLELYENTTDAIMELSEEGFTSCNKATLKLFGFDSETEFSSKNPADVSPEFQPNGLLSTKAARTKIQEAFQNGSARFEWVHLRTDGSEFDCEVLLNCHESDDGRIIQASIRDISDRKAAEAVLKDQKQAAELANKAKSEFLANMSHEIRTPLNAILGFTDVLRQSDYTAQEKDDFLQLIHSSGDHLLSLINDILDLSKIEAGKMEFAKEDCSPWGIINDVVSALRIQAEHKNLTLKAVAKTALPKLIESDKIRLKQLLTNLIGNALKFTEDGGVWIGASWIEPNKNTNGLDEPNLIIEVRDTGIGISEDSIEQLFTPFNQGDNSITRRFGGTGLGLAISNRIAEGFGGRIEIESKKGFGSVFRVLIPTPPYLKSDLNEAAALNRPSKRKEFRTPSEERIPSNLEFSPFPDNLHILLCEDGVTNQLLIKQILKKANIKVTVAENGKKCVDAYTAAPETFDIILMDMQMPVMDGYTASRILRETGYQGAILALTANAMRGDRERCLEAGCSDYITKPIQLDKFMESITKAYTAHPKNVSH